MLSVNQLGGHLIGRKCRTGLQQEHAAAGVLAQPGGESGAR
jgi:hypothetical protein